MKAVPYEQGRMLVAAAIAFVVLGFDVRAQDAAKKPLSRVW